MSTVVYLTIIGEKASCCKASATKSLTAGSIPMGSDGGICCTSNMLRICCTLPLTSDGSIQSKQCFGFRWCPTWMPLYAAIVSFVTCFKKVVRPSCHTENGSCKQTWINFGVGRGNMNRFPIAHRKHRECVHMEQYGTVTLFRPPLDQQLFWGLICWPGPECVWRRAP